MTRTAAEKAAIVRDGDTCLRCGRNVLYIPASLHHRKLKGRKTPKREWDLVENIATLCGSGTTGCHGWAHAERKESEAAGWTVWSWDDPAAKPLYDLRGNVIMLLPDGTKITDPALVLPDYPTPF